VTYYLDTNVIVSMFRVKDPRIEEKLKAVSHKDIKIPSMVIAELIAGVHNDRGSKEKMGSITTLLTTFETVPFDVEAAKIYGKIWAELKAEGNMIGSADLTTAATVLSCGGILVTNNIKDFSRIKGLRTEDWIG